MKPSAKHVTLALVALAGCSWSMLTIDSPCSQDADCGANAYCDMPLNDCPGDDGLLSAAPGQCHRSCWNSACVCTNDSDCPGSSCAEGKCLALGVSPSCATAGCADECVLTTLAEERCPVCLCATCPIQGAGSGAPDAGDASDGGQCIQGGEACQVHGPDTCCPGTECTPESSDEGRCCNQRGMACANSGQCCGGLVCAAGLCEGVPIDPVHCGGSSPNGSCPPGYLCCNSSGISATDFICTLPTDAGSCPPVM